MRWLAFGLMLSGCASEPLIEQESFRERSVPIASQTNVGAEQMAGEWVVRAAFSQVRVTGSGLTFSVVDGGELQFLETSGFCDDDICGELEHVFAVTQTGPGRWRTVGLTGTLPAEELWVLWADADNRTMAIGTPSGAFGWIMDRGATGGEDRIAAARDIMAWMGYRIDEMVTR